MGCWNATCALSRYPIHAGEPVVAFPVLMEAGLRGVGGSGFCEPTDTAQPLTVGLRGVYNDYGGIEELDPLQSERMRAYAQALAPQLVNARGRAVRVDTQDLETLINGRIGQGELHVRDKPTGSSSGTLRPLGLMLVHRRLHDDLVAEKGKERPWRNPRSTVRKDLEASLLSSLAQGPLSLCEPTSARMALMTSVALYPSFLAAFVDSARGHKRPKDALRDVVDLRLFHYVLAELRNHWGVFNGVGSQASFSPLHDTLNGFMRAHLQEFRRQEEAYGT